MGKHLKHPFNLRLKLTTRASSRVGFQALFSASYTIVGNLVTGSQERLDRNRMVIFLTLRVVPDFY